jgi:hypothetical protein
MCRPDLHFGRNVPNGSRDRCACDTVEDTDCRVPSQNADRAPSAGTAKVCPVDVVSRYHSGRVSAASRSDAASNPGFGGSLV